jgi:serine/threonine-protein kinase HipA
VKRSGQVFINDHRAGTISEIDTGFSFTYDAAYLADPTASPISLTMPKRTEAYVAPHLFPAFCGILAEGSLATIQCRTQRIDERDLFGRLLATCHDTIGALSVRSAP